MTDTQIHYQGRLWDAPLTDGAIKVDYLTGLSCILCREEITAKDDAILNTWANQPYHLECYIRGPMGDVAHLEKRCMCFRGKGNEIITPADMHATYREGAKAALQWLLDNHQGRFRP